MSASRTPGEWHEISFEEAALRATPAVAELSRGARLAVAECVNACFRELSDLSGDADAEIRLAVVKNPSSSLATVRRLEHDDDARVRAYALALAEERIYAYERRELAKEQWQIDNSFDILRTPKDGDF